MFFAGYKPCSTSRSRLGFFRLKDPKTWFRICDVDGDRRLSRDEVISALKAQLPLATEQKRFSYPNGFLGSLCVCVFWDVLRRIVPSDFDHVHSLICLGGP